MEQQSQWRTIGKRVMWPVGVVVAVLAILFVINRFFIHHPLWDWIKLLIVPAILAGGGLWFNTQQREREQRTAEHRAQDDTLQAYLDGTSQLLTDKERPLHRAQPGDSLRTVARARTLTVLGRLDSGRKRSVMQFLYESGLIYKEQILLYESNLIGRRHTSVSLQKADLSGANLSGANLRDANLIGANLIGAYLTDADLRLANLTETNLSGVSLSTSNLTEANLTEANLRGAYLTWADLKRADLSYANGVTSKQLSAAKSLEGAIMPDGVPLRGDMMDNQPTLEDWIKYKKAREEGEEAEEDE